MLVAYEGDAACDVIEKPVDIIKGESRWDVFSAAGLGMALYDIDQDGKKELCGLGYDPTSGLFTFEVTVWEDGKIEYFGCFCTKFYYLSFVEDEAGIMRIQGITQGDSPETLYFDMTAADGRIQLTHNEEPLSSWGPME